MLQSRCHTARKVTPFCSCGVESGEIHRNKRNIQKKSRIKICKYVFVFLFLCIGWESHWLRIQRSLGVPCIHGQGAGGPLVISVTWIEAKHHRKTRNSRGSYKSRRHNSYQHKKQPNWVHSEEGRGSISVGRLHWGSSDLADSNGLSVFHGLNKDLPLELHGPWLPGDQPEQALEVVRRSPHDRKDALGKKEKREC